MRLNHATMFARVLEGDASWNGRFFTGVLTTGIYCLPGCKARKPKPENVRFFPTCEAARAAGLRACRKCHPDDFARGADPVLEDIETLVAEIRDRPAAFADVRTIVRRSGFGATRLFELFRLHFHTTPADLLLRARLDQARRLLASTDRGLLAIADECGFESVSVFHEHFRRLNGLTPGAYRGLSDGGDFSLAMPDAYPAAYLRRALGRDPESLTERLAGDDYVFTTRIRDRPVLIRLRLSAERVAVGCPAGTAFEAHRIVAGLLGLDQEAAAFARLARRLGLGRLVRHREGLRIVQTASVFEGILWAVIGQQINLPFACRLRRRLIERTSAPFPGSEGLFAPPTPAAVAALTPAELRPLQFSRQKAGCVTAIARLVADGALDLASLRHLSATRAERTLLAVRGLGPWSVNYLMMRSLGFPDCLPLGDTGVTSGLQALLTLEERPDSAATRRLMAVFSPFRSLATAHLWQYRQSLPA
jgi:AraC family transcriptional regulator of adaptative response / DNA-3-methyladenine glycosylase II